jgi:ornithine cyclodeaminase
VEHIFCADARRQYANKFAAMVQASGQTQVTVCDYPEEILTACGLTIFATTATTPHLHDSALLRHHPLLLHISLRDLAPELIARAQNIVDDVAHVLQAQTSVHLAEQMTGHRAFIASTLGDVLAGTCWVANDAPLIFSPFGLHLTSR